MRRHSALLWLVAGALVFLSASPMLAQVGDPHSMSQPWSPVEPEPQPQQAKPYPSPSGSPSDSPSADASPSPEASPSVEPTRGIETHINVEAGVQSVNVSGNSSYFENYRDIQPGGLLERLDLTTRDRATPWYLNLHAFDIGLTDQNVNLNTGSYNWRLNVGYDGTPRVYSTTAETIFGNSAPNIFTLSAASKGQFINAGVNPAAFSAVVNSLLVPTSLGYERTTTAGGLSYDLTSDLSVGAAYSQIQRQGNQPQDTTFFFTNEVELAAPVSDLTTRSEFAASYGHAGKSLSFDVWNQTYNNNFSQFSFDNPIALVDSALGGPAVGVIGTAPSNTANQVSLAGGINLGQFRLTGYGSTGTWDQHDTFLPQTSNSALAVPANPLPIGNFLPGNIQRDMQDFNVTSKLSKTLSFKAWFRHSEMDNSTPNFIVPGGTLSIADTVVGNTDVARLAYGFSHIDSGMDLTWRFKPGLSSTFEYRHDTWDRTNRDVSETDEDKFSLNTNWQPNQKFTLNAKLESGVKNVGTFTPFFDEDVLLRDFDEAPNNNQSIHALARWDPNDRLEVYGEFNGSAVNYTQGFLGRSGMTDSDASVGMSYAVSSVCSAYLDFSNETYNVGQNQQVRTVLNGLVTNSPLDLWTSADNDVDNVLSLGLNCRLPHSWLLDASYVLTSGTGTVIASGIPGGDVIANPPPFPNVAYNLNVLQVALSKKLDANTRLKLKWRFEDYRQNDFTNDIMSPYMGFIDPEAAQSVYLGATHGSYTANVVQISVSKKY